MDVVPDNDAMMDEAFHARPALPVDVEVSINKDEHSAIVSGALITIVGVIGELEAVTTTLSVKLSI